MILELIFMIENFIFKLGCSNSEKSVKTRSKQQVESKATAGKPYWYARHDVPELIFIICRCTTG